MERGLCRKRVGSGEESIQRSESLAIRLQVKVQMFILKNSAISSLFIRTATVSRMSHRRDASRSPAYHGPDLRRLLRGVTVGAMRGMVTGMATPSAAGDEEGEADGTAVLTAFSGAAPGGGAPPGAPCSAGGAGTKAAASRLMVPTAPPTTVVPSMFAGAPAAALTKLTTCSGDVLHSLH